MSDDDDVLANNGMLPREKKPMNRLPTPSPPLGVSRETSPHDTPSTPTSPAPAAPVAFVPTIDQWAQLIEALKNNKDADLHAAATIHAQAMKKALRPENEIAPGISAYNPKGERDFPRPKPRQIYMLARYPICEPGNYDTTTWAEIELLNTLKGGAYTVTKADGTDVEVLVKGETDSAGRPYKMTLFADGKGIQDDDQKNNWPPLLQILTQMILGERPEQSYARYQAIIDRQAVEIAALKGAA